MWLSKTKRGMWTGRAVKEALTTILDKLTEAEKTTGIASFFMFENTQKRNPRDPDFTIYVDVGQEYSGNQGGGYGRGQQYIDDRRGDYQGDRF